MSGAPVAQPAIAYVDDWFKGFGILTLYNNGAYTPGQEPPELLSCSSADDLIQNIVSEYNKTMRAKYGIQSDGKTFSEVYEEFYNWKFEQDKSR